MKMRSRLLIAGTLAALVAGPALADLGYNPGSVAIIFDFICFTTKHCSAHVPVNSAGTETATSANPFRVDPTGTTTQPVSAASLPLPAGAATSAKQPALGTAGAASTDVLTVQGIASMTPFLNNPGTAANWGIGTSTQNSATVANGQLGLAQFNTSPTTITSGNMSPLQMDSGGKLLVNCTGCSASTAITTWAGGTLGAMANYGTAPSAVLVPGVNAFVTNSNANGQTAMANSSPVVVASNQSQIPVDAIVTPSNSFTRPANTTAYASGQLVANSTTAGSVVPLSWTSAARVSGGNFYIRRVRVTLSSKSVTLTSFRVHFYTVTPTIANGDGAAWSTTLANYVCKMDVPVASWDAGTDVSIGFGLPTSGDGNECNVVASTQTLFALVEARAAYAPASGETVTVIPEIHQN